jgi:hypothetical protein
MVDQKNVAGKLQCMLLDLKLSSYKNGVLPQAMVSCWVIDCQKADLTNFDSAIVRASPDDLGSH